MPACADLEPYLVQAWHAKHSAGLRSSLYVYHMHAMYLHCAWRAMHMYAPIQVR